MKTPPRFRVLALGSLGLGLWAPAVLAQSVRPMEQNIRPGQVGPAAARAAPSAFDAAPAPLHPDFTSRPPPPPAPPETPAEPPPPPPAPVAILSTFAKAYEAAGAPRIAILYNETFAKKITSWTMDAKEVLQMPPSVEGKAGFSTENLQWIFEEGFAKPFMAAGVRLVDPALVMQAANRREGWREAQQAADINTKIEALKLHTDWVVEVLMVPDSRTVTGFLFRTSLKRLADGRIIASGLSTLEDFKRSPAKTKVIYDDTGYRFISEEGKKPTVDDYAQSIGIQLLLDLTPKLPRYAVEPQP